MEDRPGGSEALKRDVVELLRGGNAHIGVGKAVAGLPAAARGLRPGHLPYSVWELLEHMRLTQRDILRYTLDPGWSSPSWPDGYWPEPREPVADAAWDETLESFDRDRSELIDFVDRPETDLMARLPHGGSRTYLRQALVAADHNAYHTAQIVVVRRALGNWED